MEHKLIRGGEQYLPFARKQIKSLRATGLKYAIQRHQMPDAEVVVKIVGQQDYINISGEIRGILWVLLTGVLEQHGPNATISPSLITRKTHVLLSFKGLSTARKRFAVESKKTAEATITRSVSYVSGTSGGVTTKAPYEGGRQEDCRTWAGVVDDILPVGKLLGKLFRWRNYTRNETQGDVVNDFPISTGASTSSATLIDYERLSFGGINETLTFTDAYAFQKAAWGTGVPETPQTGDRTYTGSKLVSTSAGANWGSYKAGTLTAAVFTFNQSTPFTGGTAGTTSGTKTTAVKELYKTSNSGWAYANDADQVAPGAFVRTPNTPGVGAFFAYLSGMFTGFGYPQPPESTNYKAGFHPIPAATPLNPPYTQRQLGVIKQGWDFVQYTQTEGLSGTDYSLVFQDRRLSAVAAAGSTVLEVSNGWLAKNLRGGGGSIALTKDIHVKFKFGISPRLLQMVKQSGANNQYNPGGADPPGYLPVVLKEIDLLAIAEVANNPILYELLKRECYSSAFGDTTVTAYGSYADDNSFTLRGQTPSSSGLGATAYDDYVVKIKIVPDQLALMDPNTLWFDPVKDA